MEEFVVLVEKKALEAIAEHEALCLKLRDVRSKMIKVLREIDLLKSLLEYHGKEKVVIKEDK